MLSKNKIDKKLRNYIREHLSRGYSRHSIKKVLTNHGYDENYVDGLIRKHSELQFVKINSIFVSLLFVVSFFAFNLFTIKAPSQEITGYAVGSSSNEGCCTSVCQQTSKNECYGKFVAGGKCNNLEECNVGCCIDKEGYCLTNYLSGNCIGSNGTNINRDCRDIVFCRNITDKSYASRLYSISGKKGMGIPALKPVADYYNSSFSIQYYLYDRTDVLSVKAEIKDNGKIIDSIELYDDGSHNDGARNDNLYGNNWLSSKIRDFDGFKKLDADINIKYRDGTQQQISKAGSAVVLNNNKCLPIFNEWAPEKPSIIFAAGHYEEQQKFEADVQSFIGVLLSTDKLAYKQNLNIYRLDQSLSYFNIPTLASIASGSCPSYSNKKDMIVVLDNDEKYCVREGLRMIRVNPKALFYKNITSFNTTDAFADFCSFALTPQKLADEIMIFATPPKIFVDAPDNMAYNATSINLSFSVSAANYPVNTSVFLDGLLVLNRMSDDETAESIVLNLTNETSFVFIKSVDRNRNKAFAQLLLNKTQ